MVATLNLRTVLLFTCVITQVWGYKFLGVFNMPSKSHNHLSTSLMKGLVKAGHEVTVVSAFPPKENIANYTHIHIPALMKAMEDDMKSVGDTVNNSLIQNIINFHQMGIRLTEVFLQDAAVQKLMKSNEKFDAVIFEVFINEALAGFSELFNVPLIGIGAFGAYVWNTDMVGGPSPPSYIPNAMMPFTDRMTLLERIGNLGYLTFERLLMDYYYLPQQAALYDKYFPHLKRSMYEVRRNTALVLLNHHVSLSFARPYVPNQIEVGGMQINEERKPLPENIQQFIDGAKHGVVYFSMGSNIESKNLPPEKRQAIMDTFRGLKQRVLWKFEDTTLEGKPDNVMISAWFPQDDILAHPNVKLFVTHGGLLSTTESIYHGKPVVGIPMFGDQFINMARAEANGFGIKLDFLTLSKESFTEAIQKVLGDSSYFKKAQEMSKRFRDQDKKPLDKAVYWVEHVVRHKGAEYLRNAGQRLNFIQYHNIDAMFILFGGLLAILVALVKLLRCILRLVFGRKSTAAKTGKVKKN